MIVDRMRARTVIREDPLMETAPSSPLPLVPTKRVAELSRLSRFTLPTDAVTQTSSPA